MPEPVQEAAQPQPPVPSIAIESVAAKAVDPGESLKTVKRRRQPKKAEEPAVEQAAKPAQEKPKKKEDSEALLQSRMEALRREVENRKTDSAQPKAQAQGRGGSGESDEKINRWFRDVKQRINAKWSLPADLPGGHRTIIGVQITESGAIATAGVDESSGDPVFDRSAMRAVVQAAPFPPAPMELRERIREAGGLAFRFTPKGLQ
jgi:colicin import membrane protein